MMLSELLRDRDRWQNNTVKRMKDALLYKPTNVSTTPSGDQLVVVYGAPQIGKTTLILNLLGIFKEHQDEVYEVLRAGVKKGNSSTSTAIIYQKSPTDLYGVRYENSLGQSEKEIQYFNADGIIRFLIDVRESVEHGNGRKEILYIYLPKKFFSDEAYVNENIDILDLPGYGSRNENEADHVQDILRKYLTMASVGIIACKGNEIQSLETLDIQGDPNWQMQPNKYIGVITNAYGQGSIKKYFAQNMNERNDRFDVYVDDQYKTALHEILPVFCQVKFYPVDMGESLKKLLDSLQIEDQIIIEETLNNKFKCIRDEILSHKGNTLKSTIDLLKTYSSEYVSNQLADLRADIADSEMQYAIVSQQKSEKIERLSECVTKISSLHEKYKYVLSMENHRVNCSCQFYLQTINDYIGNQFDSRISDPNHLINKKFKELLLLYLKNLNQQVEFAELGIGEAEKVYFILAQEIPFEAEIDSLLYPKGLINMLSKANKEKCVEIISHNFKLIEASVSKMYERRKQLVLEHYKTPKEKYLSYKLLKAKCEREIESSSRKLDELDYELQLKNGRLIALERNKEKDQQVLSEYLTIAKEEFSKQISHYCSMLPDSTREQKATIIIFMALLGRDYNNLMRGDYDRTTSDNGNRSVIPRVNC